MGAAPLRVTVTVPVRDGDRGECLRLASSARDEEQESSERRGKAHQGRETMRSRQCHHRRGPPLARAAAAAVTASGARHRLRTLPARAASGWQSRQSRWLSKKTRSSSLASGPDQDTLGDGKLALSRLERRLLRAYISLNGVIGGNRTGDFQLSSESVGTDTQKTTIPADPVCR